MTGNRPAKTHNMIVQPRDLEFLRLLAMLGVVDRDIYMLVAGFHSITRANTRLLKLFQNGLLRRFFLGSGGGRKALYALSPKGAQFAGVPLRGPRRRQGELLIGDFYVQHQLTINTVYCALACKPIPVPEVRFVRWKRFDEAIAPDIKLIPDGYAELDTLTGRIHSFVEVDLGHESLPVWDAKARHYLQLSESEELEESSQDEPFRVLVLVNSERRLRSIRKTVKAVTEKLFWFATLEATAENFFASVWLRPTSDQPKPLIENHL